MQSPNILLGKDYTAKIADTGLARTLFSKTHLSKALPGGTYNWQAPECIMGLPASYSADIFSYGVVMLEIISGERQHRGRYSEIKYCPSAVLVPPLISPDVAT